MSLVSSNPQQQAVELIAAFIAREVGDPDLLGIMRDQARRLVKDLTEAGLLVTPQASSAERSEEELVHDVARAIRDAYEAEIVGALGDLTDVSDWYGEARAALAVVRGGGR